MAEEVRSNETISIDNLPDGATKIAISSTNARSLWVTELSLAIFAVILCLTPFIEWRATVALLASALCCSFVMHRVRDRSFKVEESIIVFPGLGVQLVATDGSSQFFAASDIDHISVNEGFEHCRIVVYLVLVTPQKRCVVLFNRVRPSLPTLVRAFEVLDSWLVRTKSIAATEKQQDR